jgi:probable F420-dependent oxidoreductase
VRLGVTAFLTDRGMAPAELGRAAEERGFASLFLPEHTHLPLRADAPPAVVAGVEPDDYKRGLDPLVALAAAATTTSRIRLGTGVLLVAQHDPILLAKQLATLDHLSGGRLVVGVGFGWNRAEAEDHGVPFAERRAVAREHVLCMQRIWHDDAPTFHGRFVHLDPCWSWPKPLGRAVPILVGGGANRAVFEAVCEYADGWMPIGGAGLSRALERLTRVAEDRGRDPGRIEVLPFGSLPDVAKLERYARLGVGEVVLRLPNGPAGEMLRRLDELAGLVDLCRGLGPVAAEQ